MLQVLAVILAGGASSRMGRPKALVELNGKSLLQHVIDGLSPQTDHLFLSADDDYGSGIPFAPDLRAARPGPLAGIETALAWLRDHQPDLAGIVTAPVDGPYPDPELIVRLTKSDGPAIAICGGKRQPTCGFWPADLADEISRFLDASPRLSLIAWAEHVGARNVEFQNPRSFININRPEDLEKLATAPDS